MSKLEKLSTAAAKAADSWRQHLAKGGKVRGARRVSEWLESIFRGDAPREHDYPIENSPEYTKILQDARWDPAVSPREFEVMEQSHFPFENINGEAPPWMDMDPLAINKDLEELIQKHGLELPEGTQLHRGLDIGGLSAEDMLLNFVNKQGQVLPGSWPQSTTMDPMTAIHYAFQHGRSTAPLVLRGETEKGVRALPRVFLSQDEFMLPSEARFYAKDVKNDPGYIDTVVRKKAEGGKVGDNKNRLGDLSKLAALPNPLMPASSAREKQLLLRGLLSQWYGLNDAGDPEFLGGKELHNWPGIVDEVISMPTLLPDRFVPEASKSAAQRLEALSARMHQDMDVAPAEGFTENLYDAAGTMAAQIPTGGAKAVEGVVAKQAPGALRKAGRFLKNAGEWFTPTVEATPSNYIIGTTTGAGLNTLAGQVPEPEKAGVNVISKYAEGGDVADEIGSMKRRYSSSGGTDRALKAIKSAISAIESGDHSSVASLLAPHRSNEVVAGVLKTLGLEEE
jgi:hypothetical protein